MKQKTLVLKKNFLFERKLFKGNLKFSSHITHVSSFPMASWFSTWSLIRAMFLQPLFIRAKNFTRFFFQMFRIFYTRVLVSTIQRQKRGLVNCTRRRMKHPALCLHRYNNSLSFAFSIRSFLSCLVNTRFIVLFSQLSSVYFFSILAVFVDNFYVFAYLSALYTTTCKIIFRVRISAAQGKNINKKIIARFECRYMHRLRTIAIFNLMANVNVIKN